MHSERKLHLRAAGMEEEEEEEPLRDDETPAAGLCFTSIEF